MSSSTGFDFEFTSPQRRQPSLPPLPVLEPEPEPQPQPPMRNLRREVHPPCAERPPPRHVYFMRSVAAAIIENPHLTIFILVSMAVTYCYWPLAAYVLDVIRTQAPEDYTSVFFVLFALRYGRLFVNLWGSIIYEPCPIPQNPQFTHRDVSIILPTIDPDNEKFAACIESMLANQPNTIFIVTVGASMRAHCERIAEKYRRMFPQTSIGVSAILHPSKRRQVAHAVPRVRTEFTILADDHVVWPSARLIPSALAPFHGNRRMGAVATHKRVVRTTPGRWSRASVRNLIGCFYLERHNWELRASNAVDGGVFVVSGRTAVYRTDVLQRADLMRRFCNERFFFGLFGGEQGLGPDDDNFLTREVYKMGMEVKFQQTAECTIETTIGDESAAKLRGQLVRWARTTFRSNPCMLIANHDVTTRTMPYSWGAVYLAALTNFALLWDPALVYTFYSSTRCEGLVSSGMAHLVLWILATKTVKLWPHFARHPEDFPLIVFQILFGYVHSFIKFWALVTFWDCAWLGRNLDAVDEEATRQAAMLDTGFSWQAPVADRVPESRFQRW